MGPLGKNAYVKTEVSLDLSNYKVDQKQPGPEQLGDAKILVLLAQRLEKGHQVRGRKTYIHRE